MKASRELLYETFGEEFGRRRFCEEALGHLNDELRLPDAAKYMSTLPDEQQKEWLRFAASLYKGRISDAGWVVRAAGCAQVIAEGRGYVDMCRGPGTHIRACPERATYRVKVAQCVRCTTERPEGADEHDGHLFCEWHRDRLVAGEYEDKDGKLLSSVSFTGVAEAKELVPF